MFYAVKALLDPGLLPNSGMFEAVRISAPERARSSIRAFPAAVGARSITCQKIAGAIFGAFRGLLPPQSRSWRRATTCCRRSCFPAGTGGHQRTYVYLETLGGGAGARLDRDGMDGVQVHVTNTSNLPVEALENEYPLLVEEYGLVPGSGGAGRSRGGLGIARQIRALEDGTVFGCRSDSHLTRAEGVFGGEPTAGPAASSTTPAAPTKRHLSSKVSRLASWRRRLDADRNAGGGGAGPPAEREAVRREADASSGKAPGGGAA